MSDQFTITYVFTLRDQRKAQYDLVFDAHTVELVNPADSQPPFWTALGYEQCGHCPLSTATHDHCPVAVNLVPAMGHFDQLMSFDKIAVEVISAERHVMLNTSAQEGFSSLMGLLIAGSSCPHTHFFKPMARFHLPFASKDETMWRAAATYLLGRYFAENDLTPQDMRMDGLVAIYNDVARLNDAMVQRLRAASSRDSAVNALVHLDVFAKFLMPPLEDT
ncbi:MAG: hypothetical protein HKP58_01400, partial [Desulfatitalea sp.]|nr:hypothetical protein [Desulfatitalea sp.]NNJ99042.1 hypothetical protein [Desulfatitalea sp.]